MDSSTKAENSLKQEVDEISLNDEDDDEIKIIEVKPLTNSLKTVEEKAENGNAEPSASTEEPMETNALEMKQSNGTSSKHSSSPEDESNDNTESNEEFVFNKDLVCNHGRLLQ